MAILHGFVHLRQVRGPSACFLQNQCGLPHEPLRHMPLSPTGWRQVAHLLLHLEHEVVVAVADLLAAGRGAPWHASVA